MADRKPNASAVDHAFHLWINRRQDDRRKAGEPFEHDLYEWKSMLQEVERLPSWLRRARTNALPTAHQQCSRQAPEGIADNRLICALGMDVTLCPILASLYVTFDQEREHRERLTATWRERGDDEARLARHALSADDADEVAAKVCTWHIFMSKLQRPGLDTSEGYVQDESDRRFWKRTYENMSAAIDDGGDGEDAP
jgi:hypothetical protein